MVRMLGEDSLRRLPDKSRTAEDAKTGMELELFDRNYLNSDADSRISTARSLSIYGKVNPEECRIISEECEYTDSYDDTVLIDSQGFEGRHT